MKQAKKTIHLLADFLGLNMAMYLTFFWFTKGWSFYSTQDFQTTLLLANGLWFATLLYSSRIYTQFEYKSIEAEVKTLAPNYLIYIVAFYAIAINFFPRDGFSFSLFYGLLLAFLLSSRIFIKFALSYKTLNFITIGHCHAIVNIEKALSESHRGKTNYLGSFSDDKNKQKRHLGSTTDISNFLKSNKVNLILYVSNAMNRETLCALMHYAKHHFIEFKIIPVELDYITEGAKLELHHGVFLSAKDEYYVHLRNRFLKRTFDIVFSSLVIICILSWLFPIICLCIYLESKSAPLFAQDRVGFQGRVFKCLKFRSMRVKENGAVVEQAIKNDGRITKIGAWLRKTSLDEMPQFFNVFMGDMSVVGPRPHAVSHDIHFKNTTEDYMLRHYMKPGITGWAQVNGWRGPTDTYPKIFGRTQCDLWYARNRSLQLDIKIIFLTIFGSKVKQNVF
jgi:putative colanic acid biosysnthesis UDP-glucose lipid carrier transferase